MAQITNLRISEVIPGEYILEGEIGGQAVYHEATAYRTRGQLAPLMWRVLSARCEVDARYWVSTCEDDMTIRDLEDERVSA
jgi:hypothetical protein